MKKCGVFLLGLLLLCGGVTTSHPVLAFNNPHTPVGPGPWFEGWYTRITDANGERSLAVIVGSHLREGEKYQPGACLPGYIQILLSEDQGAPVLAFEAFPECTHALANGQPVQGWAGFSGPSDFEWVAEGYGNITDDSVDLEIPGGARVRARFAENLSWREVFGEVGPEGLLSVLPLPMHWYVHSLGSRAEFEYEILDGAHVGGPIESTGYAHQEKNWGNAFPQAWMWIEGIGGENRSQLVAGGGKLAIGPMMFRPWILGYHSPSIRWDFNFARPGTVFQTEIDPCRGYFHLRARTPTRTLDVTASAPLDSFGMVGIPQAEGFVSNGAIESFSATIQVKAYRHTTLTGLFGVERLVEEQVFTNAVLEFGADYKHCSPN